MHRIECHELRGPLEISAHGSTSDLWPISGSTRLCWCSRPRAWHHGMQVASGNDGLRAVQVQLQGGIPDG